MSITEILAQDERTRTNGKHRVYVSGPISGIEDPWSPFEAAEKDWRARGYRVINPARYRRKMPWDLAMRIALRKLSRADTCVVLPGWDKSQGAKLEVRVAWELGLPVRDAMTGLSIQRPEHLELF